MELNNSILVSSKQNPFSNPKSVKRHFVQVHHFFFQFHRCFPSLSMGLWGRCGTSEVAGGSRCWRLAEATGSPLFFSPFFSIGKWWFYGKIIGKPWENHGKMVVLPSGKKEHNYGKSPSLTGKSAIDGPFSRAMVKLPEGIYIKHPGFHQYVMEWIEILVRSEKNDWHPQFQWTGVNSQIQISFVYMSREIFPSIFAQYPDLVPFISPMSRISWLVFSPFFVA